MTRLCVICPEPMVRRKGECGAHYRKRLCCCEEHGRLLGKFRLLARSRGRSLAEVAAEHGYFVQEIQPDPIVITAAAAPESAPPARVSALDAYRAKWAAALMPAPDPNSEATQKWRSKRSGKAARKQWLDFRRRSA